MNNCDLLYYAECDLEQLLQKVMHRNAHSTLIYVKSGGGAIFIDDVRHAVSIGDILVVPGQTGYRCWCEGPVEYLIIGFSQNCANFPQTSLFIHDNGKFNILNLIGLMQTEFKERLFNRKEFLNLLLNSILIAVCRLAGASDDKKGPDSDNFCYIINFINEFSQSSMDIEKIAEMSGLSYHRFRHRFKEITGLSPQQYIIHQRINKAKNILETTAYSTSLIARDCGFNSVPQFITCFNKQVGLTPSNYRRQYLAQKRNGGV